MGDGERMQDSTGERGDALAAENEPKRYEILSHLATGGMAEVFLARRSGPGGFEKLVVIKRILPNLALNPDFVRMFLDEARIAATLRHNNIVQVYDVDASGGTVFYAMEYLHGCDVRDVTRAAQERGFARGLPLEHALGIVLPVCAGLHYAHEGVGLDGKQLSIVHRDVSPHNVFVTFEGEVKLLDFGIAKAANRMGGTTHGTLKGKFGYMSPEQCQQKPLDRRSDIFSLSTVLYELTTGTRLFGGDSEYEFLRTVVERDAPPPSTRVAGYPPQLERIVLKGLRRDPAERYPTARDLQLDLEEFAADQRIRVSSLRLAAFAAELFPNRIETWRSAQRRGATLADHLASTTGAGAGAGGDEELARTVTDAEARPTETRREAPLRATRPPAARSRNLWVMLALGIALGASVAAAVGVYLYRRAGGAAPAALDAAPALAVAAPVPSRPVDATDLVAASPPDAGSGPQADAAEPALRPSGRHKRPGHRPDSSRPPPPTDATPRPKPRDINTDLAPPR